MGDLGFIISTFYGLEFEIPVLNGFLNVSLSVEFLRGVWNSGRGTRMSRGGIGVTLNYLIVGSLYRYSPNWTLIMFD